MICVDNFHCTCSEKFKVFLPAMRSLKIVGLFIFVISKTTFSVFDNHVGRYLQIPVYPCIKQIKA